MYKFTNLIKALNTSNPCKLQIPVVVVHKSLFENLIQVIIRTLKSSLKLISTKTVLMCQIFTRNQNSTMKYNTNINQLISKQKLDTV